MTKIIHYTNQERELLATLIKDHPLLESKKTDNSTAKEKLAEWKKLTAKYNGRPEVCTTRSSFQLKILWKNLKQKKKKQTMLEKHEDLMSGGGSAKKCNDDVENASQYMDVYLSNTFDSTSTLERSTTHTYEENLENSTTDPSQASTSYDAMCKLETDEPTCTVNDSSISCTEEEAQVPSETRRTLLKRKACEEENIRIERIKAMVGADAELHDIRLEIANLEKLKAISNLNKARYEEEIARITLERLNDTI